MLLRLISQAFEINNFISVSSNLNSLGTGGLLDSPPGSSSLLAQLHASSSSSSSQSQQQQAHGSGLTTTASQGMTLQVVNTGQQYNWIRSPYWFIYQRNGLFLTDWFQFQFDTLALMEQLKKRNLGLEIPTNFSGTFSESIIHLTQS